jgi:hypothetical protein
MAEPRRLLWCDLTREPGLSAAELTSDGLSLHHDDGAVQTWPWSQIAWAERTSTGLRTVISDGGEVQLRIVGRRRESFLNAVRALTDHGATPEDLAPAVVEAWLGVEPGGALTIHRGFGCQHWLLIATLVFASCIGVNDPTRHIWLRPFGFAIILAFYVGHLAVRDTVHLSADGQGLVAGRGRRRLRCAWSEVRGIQWLATGWRIETDRGPIQLGRSPQVRGLVDIVKRVLAVRAAGRGLPSEPPLAETALSRMTGEADADRGLSVVEGDGDGG